MRVSGFVCSRKRASKSWFWWSSTTMALSFIRQFTRIIRSSPVLGGMERGICSLKYPKLPQSLIWIWGSTYRLGMLTVLSIMWSEKRTIMLIIWHSWRKSYQIPPMEMKGNLLRFGWMVPEERALKRSIMNLKNGLKPFMNCREIA